MSIGAAISGSVFCHASSSNSIICSTSRDRWALSTHGQQQMDVIIYPIAGVSYQVARFKLGHTGGGRQSYAGIARDSRDESGREKAAKSRVRFRIHCQVRRGGSNLTVEDWTKKFPAKRKALYSHSLPCIEAWLQSLGFIQGKEDRAVWNIDRPDWHAQLSLDVTDLHIRYLKKGPGNLERDIERKFSYALSREDLENAILGGP